MAILQAAVPRKRPPKEAVDVPDHLYFLLHSKDYRCFLLPASPVVRIALCRACGVMQALGANERGSTADEART